MQGSLQQRILLNLTRIRVASTITGPPAPKFHFGLLPQCAY
jgi:hypothetical protein